MKQTLCNSTRPTDKNTIFVDDRLAIDMGVTDITVDRLKKQIYCSYAYLNAIQLPIIHGYVWKVIDTGAENAGPQLVCVREDIAEGELE